MIQKHQPTMLFTGNPREVHRLSNLPRHSVERLHRSYHHSDAPEPDGEGARYNPTGQIGQSNTLPITKSHWAAVDHEATTPT
jgi:hypothetical protein